MKIRVTLVVEVDRADWELAYGEQESVAALRADVKRYILSAVEGTAAVEELGIREVDLA